MDTRTVRVVLDMWVTRNEASEVDLRDLALVVHNLAKRAVAEGGADYGYTLGTGGMVVRTAEPDESFREVTLEGKVFAPRPDGT